MPNILSGKKYALNKMYMLTNTGFRWHYSQVRLAAIVSLALIGYGFVLPCTYFKHLALLDHSIPAGF